MTTKLLAPRKPSMNNYRRMLRETFGSRMYRITWDGIISVYGRMPNADAMTGWYVFGQVGNADTMSRLFGDANL